MKIIPLLREITCRMGSHSVPCHPTAVTFPPLPQLKLVGLLDLATPEGCKAELTWMVVISQDGYPQNTVTYLRNNQAVLGLYTAEANFKSTIRPHLCLKTQ